ncbi:ABC transporter substrate-binding protein [Mesorhizobium sp. CN2-181]|uniref:ABC transporter substrate-binding protein n=1 Tax=Mesorhizobium yinganensis TaxID=3157707 RepID=UPI0032B7DC82
MVFRPCFHGGDLHWIAQSRLGSKRSAYRPSHLLDCDPSAIQNEFGPFLKGLEELGYKQGETFDLECQAAEKSYERLAEAARKLVQLPVDVIVTTSQPAGRAAHQATDSVPIVSIVSGDPIADGLVASLAKPGGNFTGVSYYATELTAKRLELLKEAIPDVAKIGVLANPDVSYLPFEADTMRAAGKLGIGVKLHHVRQPAEIDVAIPEMKKEDVQAIFVLPDVMLAGEAAHIAALALEQRLPTMTWGQWYPRAGCLMAYSADYVEMIHRLAFYADRILKGANAGDLPLEQPATFRLTINQKTAMALGLELPQTLLILADEVIE